MPIEPFRFLHTGDLHLDSPFVGLTAEAPPEVARALRDSTLQAWERIVKLALDEQVDFAVVAGDAFEHANRTLLAQVRFRDGLERLATAGIPSFVVTGNHDPLSGWEPTVRWPEAVHRFGAEAVEGRPVLRAGREIARVYGISYPVRDVTENLALRFRRDADTPYAVAVLHANVGGQPGHLPYSPCTLSDLRASGIEYWALGHVHKPGILSQADRPSSTAATRRAGIRARPSRAARMSSRSMPPATRTRSSTPPTPCAGTCWRSTSARSTARRP